MNIVKMKHMRTGLIGGIAALVLVAPGVCAQGLPDPTRPPAFAGEATTAAHAGPVLQSTIIAHGHRRAVISGRTYAVGDRVDGALITDIAPYEVTLERGGREFRLRLLPRLDRDIRYVENDTGQGVTR